MDARWLPADVPRLFHIANEGAWSSIEQYGLLSTSALLDLFSISGEEREALEARHRPEPVPLHAPGVLPVVLRDQKPLNMKKLAGCLHDGMTCEDWLRLLNGKVFFWPSEKRRDTLLGAKAYRDRAHEVLELDTRLLVERYERTITLSTINSGATDPVAAARGRGTFRSIARFPESERRKIAEVAVDYAVSDLRHLVIRVERRRGTDSLGVLWQC